MNGKILIVEDEKDIADVMNLYLIKENATTVWKETGEEALAVFNELDFDLVVLDINLPGMDGYETLRKIRQKSNIPVIIVSARQEDADMILGFGAGANDYVSKPFSPSVLTARIRAHLRRSEELQQDVNKVIPFGSFTLDCTHMVLKQNGAPVNLSPREMDLLIFLTEHPGEAFSQEQLYKEVWGNSFGDLSTVSVHIQRLRRKLETDSSHPQFIRTRYGYGYYFKRDFK